MIYALVQNYSHVMAVRLAIHCSVLPSHSGGALDDIRLDEELDEQSQIRAEEPTPEQRGVF